MIRKYAEIFCWKMWVAFAKATHIFSAKNIWILYIESAKTANEMTLNELVNVKTLWTTGPWVSGGYFHVWIWPKLLLQLGFQSKINKEWQIMWIQRRRLVTSSLICVYNVYKGICVLCMDKRIKRYLTIKIVVFYTWKYTNILHFSFRQWRGRYCPVQDYIYYA